MFVTKQQASLLKSKQARFLFHHNLVCLFYLLKV